MNPWEDIALSDYEKHMSLKEVGQLQMLNMVMREQIKKYPVRTAMVLGIAGGNGLEHVAESGFQKLYAIDVNEEYLKQVQKRFGSLGERLECICADLCVSAEVLPQADLLIANLLIEYIGYEKFLSTIEVVAPKFISCVIQVNAEGTWVSNSPYIHAFDCLDTVHCLIEEDMLVSNMRGIQYLATERVEYPLPNDKKFVRVDFEHASK